MSFSYVNNLNMQSRMPMNTSFRAASNPAEQQTIPADNPIDTFVKKIDEEKEKKHNKKAIAVTSSVIGISLIAALLNPRVSSKVIERLKASRLKFENKLKTSKDSFLKSKIYGFLTKAHDGIINFGAFIGNANSIKDTYFKQLCTEQNSFIGVRNNSRGFWKKTADFCRKIFKKPHEKITQWGDDLAKLTVKIKYRKAAKKMDVLETLLKEYGDKLPADKKTLFESKMKELKFQREFFGEAKLAERFIEQEKMMENLNRDVRGCLRSYVNGFKNRFTDSKDHFRKNYSFWAEEIMQTAKDGVSKQGKSAVDLIFGNKDGVKGTYNEIVELLSENLSKEEAEILKKSVNTTEKSLRKANLSECTEYFDKKRDLVLGSAPTDIVTQLAMLSGSGIALASADSKDERISEAITGTMPVVVGIGTNTVLTSMLVSGTNGLILGALTGFIVSRVGSKIDHIRLNAKSKMLAEQQNENKEAKNV